MGMGLTTVTKMIIRPAMLMKKLQNGKMMDTVTNTSVLCLFHVKNRSYIDFHLPNFLKDGVGNGHDFLAFYHCRNLDNGLFVEYDMCAKFVMGEDRTPDTFKFIFHCQFQV
mmetsp:Transcript_21780/g.39281  ORF Transcript_21780/g.39281 Transcript_21780/m.39281 type:complete len:111 (-) Transcript_21780:184-516(-)